MVESLYISDLDGTLLDGGGDLSVRSRLALQAMVDEGLAFTVASARSVVSIRERLGGLHLRLPVITLNGAYISELDTGRHEVINDIDNGVVPEIHAMLHEAGHVPFVSTWSGSEERVYFSHSTNDGMAWYIDDCRRRNDARWRQANDLRGAFVERVMCLTTIAGPGLLEELEASILERYGAHVQTHCFENLYTPGWHWLTIHDDRATKDQAIADLVDLYDLTDRELVVFGDQSNDIGMFRIADRAIAVANAVEIIRANATHRIGSNEEDSVVEFIQAEHLERRFRDGRNTDG